MKNALLFRIWIIAHYYTSPCTKQSLRRIFGVFSVCPQKCAEAGAIRWSFSSTLAVRVAKLLTKEAKLQSFI